MVKTRYKVDLPRQQAQCEANYARLCKLMPGTGDAWHFALGTDDNPRQIHIQVVERSRYTTTVQLTQLGGHYAFKDWLQLPKLTVRLYYDAKLAEVLAWEGHRRLRPRYEYPNQAMYQSDEKAQLNRFLGEWLSLCLSQGRSTLLPLV